jgi:hypothetical protein
MKTPFYATANGLFSMTDGRVQDRSGQPVAGSEGWGSDIASVEDPCGSRTAVFASSPDTGREEVRLYDVVSGQATPASDPTSLPGPVTALWPSEMHGEATMVARNLQTGQYEASRLSVVCTK